MKRNFDSRHDARELKPLSPGDTVWIAERDASGTVVRQENSPRSYTVRERDGGTLQRNRRDLVIMPRPAEPEQQQEAESSPNETDRNSSDNGNAVRTRSGRVSKPPQKYM